MIDFLSAAIVEFFSQVIKLGIPKMRDFLKTKENKYKLAVFFDILFIFSVFVLGFQKSNMPFSFISPFSQKNIQARKPGSEVFGFAPYWTFDKLGSVDFTTLTTFAYFGITVNSDGTFLTDDPGYSTFESQQATEVFKKAHDNGARVILTLTQMEANPLMAFLDDKNAQDNLTQNAIETVKRRGIDGVNIDFEYIADPGDRYRSEFSKFIDNLTSKMHREIPGSYVTVSVIASSVKDRKLYDVRAIGNKVDSIFMMAYDFGFSGSENAMPTSPLYGYKSGQYWYDVSTAVTDFLTQMPSNKLILGLPWYGYNYSVYQPGVKAQTTWARGTAQMYGDALTNITVSNPNIENLQNGWDKDGQVGWKSYFDDYSGTWRMIFLDDPKSLAIKYNFAKKEKLAGVGIWALGFDNGRPELWATLRLEFGTKIAQTNIPGIEKAYANTN